MNATQRRYAVTRIEEVYRAKLNKLENAAKRKYPARTHAELEADVKAGKIKAIRRTRHLHRYTDVKDVFELPDDYFGAEESETTDVKKSKDVLYKEYHRVRDQIMLGDSEEALKMIEAFEKFKA